MARVRIDQRQKLLTAQRAATPLVQLTTRQILVGARRLAPSGDHLSGSGRRKLGQKLRPSIQANVDVGATRVLGRVGSRKVYAATVHQGSKAHIIRARGKVLRFRWDRGDFLLGQRGSRRGRLFFFFRKVRHPGNKRPVRFLTTPLVFFGRANGFRVSTTPVSRSRLP